MPFFLTLTLPKAWFVAGGIATLPPHGTQSADASLNLLVWCYRVTGSVALYEGDRTDRSHLRQRHRSGSHPQRIRRARLDQHVRRALGHQSRLRHRFRERIGWPRHKELSSTAMERRAPLSPARQNSISTAHYLTGAWNDGLKVTVTAFLNSVQVDSQTVTTSFSTPTFFTFNFDNIDALKFTFVRRYPIAQCRWQRHRVRDGQFHVYSPSLCAVTLTWIIA